MDFSSLNPSTSNALNLAARNNDVETVERLLKKMNPACIDNRGWTCLHEAAANDSYESMLLILDHPDCRPLAETHEGHTALYIACINNKSIRTIKALLESVEDIANYGSTESVTPLHVACGLGRIEVIQLLIDYGAMVNVQDFDGDTPLHDASNSSHAEAINVLLHAGADADIKNESLFTAFHLVCFKGCLDSVKNMFAFITDVNQQTVNGETPLSLAAQGCQLEIVKFLLENGADPHIKNIYGQLALDGAQQLGLSDIFKVLLNVTDKDKFNKNIILLACKPHLFQFEILEDLLNHSLEPRYFDFFERFYITLERIGDRRLHYIVNVPLNSYLNICEYIYEHTPKKFRDFFCLFLMRGVSVNALDVTECPPIVYIHFCQHSNCFKEVFQLLIEYGCNVDYCSVQKCKKHKCIPDAFMASLISDPTTTTTMITYSLYCEPGHFIKFAIESGVICRIPATVQKQLLFMIDKNAHNLTSETLANSVCPLKHLCRLKVRSILREHNVATSTEQFLRVLDRLPLPFIIKRYLRYL